MTELELQRLTYPRVSEIIGTHIADELRSVPLDTLANACLRGTKLHAYCTAYLRGLWVPVIEEEYLHYFEAFKAWAEENVFQTLYTGVRLYDDERRFTGEFDIIAVLKDSKQIALIDLKTSCKESKSWPIQLAAYKHLCIHNGYEIETVFNLHLKKTKGAVFEEVNGKKVKASPEKIKAKRIDHEEKDLVAYWEVFDSALSCYDYFKRKEAI